ncbi:MAG: proline--tRNA ligase [archaeon]
MEKENILSYLKKNKVLYREITHIDVKTTKEQSLKAGVAESQIAKSMLYKTPAGEYILVVLPGNKTINNKKLTEELSMEVTLATLGEVKEKLGIEAGSVHPFGKQVGINTFVDKSLLLFPKIFFSPGVLNKTVEIETEDFVNLENPTVISFEPHDKKMDTKQTLGLNVTREENFSEWYTQVIQKAQLADYTKVSGCIVFRPYSYAIWEKVVSFVDPRLKKLGVQNAYFPLFIPESLLTKEKEHVKGFTPEVAWVTHAGETKLNERLAVRPTSETIMYDSYKNWIRSHNDLPLRLNQWNNVVRWEFKYAVPFLRTREFLWHEGHTAFATKEEAVQETFDVLDIYVDCFRDLYAIPTMPGRKSDTEKFAGADFTNSVEIFLPNGKAIQGATTHCLGQNFSKAFDINFLDKDGQKKYVWQNSWAITTRSIGIMIMMHGDNKGLVIPPRAAPIQAVIVPIIFEKTKEQVLEASKKIKEILSGYSVKLDDREGYSSGWKYNEWELKGVPVRIEVGPRDVQNNVVVLVRRDTGEKITVKIPQLKEKFGMLLGDIQTGLFEKAKKRMHESTVVANNWSEFVKHAENKKLIYALHCGAAECEEEIKAKTGGVKTLNTPFDAKKSDGNCIHCVKPAKYWIYFGKSY